MSFVQKAIASNGHRFYYLSAKVADNKSAWYFVIISPQKEEAFKRVDYTKPFTISDYGQIIQSGMGKQAPELVVASINKQYNTKFSNS